MAAGSLAAAVQRCGERSVAWGGGGQAGPSVVPAPDFGLVATRVPSGRRPVETNRPPSPSMMPGAGSTNVMMSYTICGEIACRIEDRGHKVPIEVDGTQRPGPIDGDHQMELAR